MAGERAVLGSLLSHTRDGEWGEANPHHGLAPVRVIRGTDFEHVRRGDLTTVPTRYLRTDYIAKKALKPRDILIETAGGSKDRPTGRTLLIHGRILETGSTPFICASFARFLRVDGTRVDPEYLYWFLQYLYRIGEMERHQIQHTGIARFQFTRFANEVEIPLPPASEQRAMAHILGTLDDKIELNHRMNETLEAMAQALFKSWIVDFEPVRAKMAGRDTRLPQHFADLFPGKLIGSVLGAIPQGWEVTTLGAIAEVTSGKRPNLRIPTASGEARVPVWGGNGPMAFTSKALLHGPALITGRVGTLGSVFRVTRPCWPSDNTLIVKSAHIQSLELLFLHMQRIDFESLNRGSTQPLVSQTDLKAVRFVYPSMNVLSRLGPILATLYARMDANDDETLQLAAVRDALLPKLISGELRVKEGEKFVGRIM